MRKRRSKLVMALILVPILFLLAPGLLVLGERIRGRVSLKLYKRHLSAAGAQLDPREFSSAASPEDDGMPELLAATAALENGDVLPSHCPRRMRLIPSGRGVVGFRQAEWAEDDETFTWDRLAADLASNREALDRIRVALERPVLESRLDYSLGAKMPLTHLAKAKTLAAWLGASCQLGLHQGRNPEALENLVAELQIPRALEHDRTLISELVRYAVAAILRADTWELLQADGWADSDLARVQEQWQRLGFANSLARAYEGERVFMIVTMAGARESNDEAYNLWFGLADLLGGSDTGDSDWEVYVPGGRDTVNALKKQVLCRFWRFTWLDQCELHELRGIERQVGIASQAAASRSLVAVEPAVDAYMEEEQPRNVYDRVRFPQEEMLAGITSRTVARALRAETDRSLCLAAIAIKRYRLRHGRIPENLEALVPEFLAAVPVDCMDGAPLRYRPRPDGTFVLYSIGEDCRDDGGDGSTPEGSSSLKRRDLIWPEPATGAE